MATGRFLKLFSLPPLTLTANIAAPISSTQLFSGSITLEADADNSDPIYFGGADVTSQSGLRLSAGDVATIEPTNLVGRNEDMDISTIWAVSEATGMILRITIMRRHST